MLLFLYGSLLDPRVLARQSGERRLALRLRPAVLAGHARQPLRGTPYPTLVRRPGAVTAGALLRPGPAALRRLAAYEGAEYRLVPVRPQGPRGPVRAHAWVAPRWRADDPPSLPQPYDSLTRTTPHPYLVRGMYKGPSR